MKITVDGKGYIANYALIGDISDSMEVSDFTGEKLDAFTENSGHISSQTAYLY